MAMHCLREFVNCVLYYGNALSEGVCKLHTVRGTIKMFVDSFYSFQTIWRSSGKFYTHGTLMLPKWICKEILLKHLTDFCFLQAQVHLGSYMRDSPKYNVIIYNVPHMSSMFVREASLKKSMKHPMRLNKCSGYVIMPFQDHCFCSNQTGSVRERHCTFYCVKNGDVRPSHSMNIYIKFL